MLGNWGCHSHPFNQQGNIDMSNLNESDLQLTDPAQQKMAELMGQIEDEIQGIRVFAQPGGCSGMSFGMTFTNKIEGNDLVREMEGVKIIVADDTIELLRGAQIDFVDRGDGNATFVFNNIPAPAGGGGCGTCGSQGGGCG